jgi:LytR cell envelope-related transcriptional attenuator
MLIVGGVIVLVVALVLVLSSGGGKSTGQGSTSGQSAEKAAPGTTTSSGTHKQASSHHSESAAAATSPAATSVAVLNGTNTTGLAHSLSKALQQSGYSQATALNGSPPGSHATTLVEYRSGHRADAQGVASALGVAQVQPMETAVMSLAGPATVVVLAGADKAATVGETPGGGGASGATG